MISKTILVPGTTVPLFTPVMFNGVADHHVILFRFTRKEGCDQEQADKFDAPQVSSHPAEAIVQYPRFVLDFHVRLLGYASLVSLKFTTRTFLIVCAQVSPLPDTFCPSFLLRRALQGIYPCPRRTGISGYPLHNTSCSALMPSFIFFPLPIQRPHCHPRNPRRPPRCPPRPKPPPRPQILHVPLRRPHVPLSLSLHGHRLPERQRRLQRHGILLSVHVQRYPIRIHARSIPERDKGHGVRDGEHVGKIDEYRGAVDRGGVVEERDEWGALSGWGRGGVGGAFDAVFDGDEGEAVAMSWYWRVCGDTNDIHTQIFIHRTDFLGILGVTAGDVVLAAVSSHVALLLTTIVYYKLSLYLHWASACQRCIANT